MIPGGGSRTRDRHGGSFSPLSLSPALWLRADAGTFQTVSGTAATADADPVGSWLDQSAAADNAAQATASKRPALKLNVASSLPMLLPDAVDDVMVLGSALALTGAFTVYAVGTRATLANWIPLGAAATSAAVGIFSDNNVYFLRDDNTFVSAAYTGSAGTIIARFRRTAANVCKFAATGMAEVTVGTLSGTFTFGTICARPNPINQFNGGTNKHGELVVKAADVLTDTPALDASTITYLQTRWGVTLP